MKVTIDSNLTIEDATDDEIRQIRAGLVVSNPNWVTAHKLGKSVWGIEPQLFFYKKDNDKIITPVGYLDAILAINPNAEIVDTRIESKCDFVFSGTLYPYQQAAFDAMKQYTNGTLCAITAAGKTVMACALIAELKQKTLILVDTIELANQFSARISQFLGLAKKEIGRLGGGKHIVKNITVATLQTLARIDPAELHKMDFGLVICDEVLDKK